jgi:nitrogen regulatory protein P-II 1
MSLKQVSAIFNEMKLSEVEKALISHGVKGFTVHKVKGRGAYFNSYGRDHLTSHVRLLTFTSDKNAGKVAQLIMDTAHAGTDNEGLVRISPVDEVHWIHSRKRCEDNEFVFHEA